MLHSKSSPIKRSVKLGKSILATSWNAFCPKVLLINHPSFIHLTNEMFYIFFIYPLGPSFRYLFTTFKKFKSCEPLKRLSITHSMTFRAIEWNPGSYGNLPSSFWPHFLPPLNILLSRWQSNCEFVNILCFYLHISTKAVPFSGAGCSEFVWWIPSWTLLCSLKTHFSAKGASAAVVTSFSGSCGHWRTWYSCDNYPWAESFSLNHRSLPDKVTLIYTTLYLNWMQTTSTCVQCSLKDWQRAMKIMMQHIYLQSSPILLSWITSPLNFSIL